MNSNNIVISMYMNILKMIPLWYFVSRPMNTLLQEQPNPPYGTPPSTYRMER